MSSEKDLTPKIINILQALFENSSLVGYSFDTNFTLVFNKSGENIYNGKKLPNTFKITLLSEWRFGSKSEWDEYKNKFDTSSAIEEDEPIQAFKLSILRWSKQSLVGKVSLNNSELSIHFIGGKALNVSNDTDEDYAWIIEEMRYESHISEWSIVSENNKVFIHGI